MLDEHAVQVCKLTRLKVEAGRMSNQVIDLEWPYGRSPQMNTTELRLGLASRPGLSSFYKLHAHAPRFWVIRITTYTILSVNFTT